MAKRTRLIIGKAVRGFVGSNPTGSAALEEVVLRYSRIIEQKLQFVYTCIQICQGGNHPFKGKSVIPLTL